MALPEQGVELAVFDWGGSGPVALAAHANGFCGRLWELVAAELVGEVRLVAFDARGHGASSAPVAGEAYAWGELAADIVGLAEVLAADRGIRAIDVGVGNSVGGTAMLAAAVRAPDRFRSLVLVDPVLLPREQYGEPAAGGPLAEGALRRRRAFATRAEVIEAYRFRSVFADWMPPVLSLYAEYGFRETADGVELCCTPEVEASVFAHATTLDPFRLAPRLQAPGLILHARSSFAREPYMEFADLAPSLRLVDLPAPHLAPMTHPALVADAVREALRSR